MTKPRLSTTRELYGLLGSFPTASEILQEWNRYFTAEGLDAFMDRYPCTEANLPERLSEMFHFDRRLYLVGEELQEAVAPLLDELDASALQTSKVNVVRNQAGRLVGFYWQNDVQNVADFLAE